MFSQELEQQDGIYRGLDKRPWLPLAQLSNFVSLTAILYEPLWRHRSLSILTGGAFSVSRELELMLQWLRLQPNQTILDAACSAGLYARTLLKADNSLKLTAVDMSLPFLKQAQRKMHEDFILVQADVQNLPFESDYFDAIVCGGSLNEMLDLPACIAELARVLKPGGRMWQMYLRRAEGPFGKLIQGLLRLSGIRFIDPEGLNALARSQHLVLSKAQHRGVVVMALFEKLKT